jgi:hypothetical protein
MSVAEKIRKKSTRVINSDPGHQLRRKKSTRVINSGWVINSGSNTLSVDDSMHWKVDLHYSLCPVAGQECAEFTRPEHWLDSAPLMARSFNLISANAMPSNDSAGGVMALSRMSTSATLMSLSLIHI